MEDVPGKNQVAVKTVGLDGQVSTTYVSKGPPLLEKMKRVDEIRAKRKLSEDKDV
jgi:hypothetical protein